MEVQDNLDGVIDRRDQFTIVPVSDGNDAKGYALLLPIPILLPFLLITPNRKAQAWAIVFPFGLIMALALVNQLTPMEWLRGLMSSAIVTFFIIPAYRERLMALFTRSPAEQIHQPAVAEVPVSPQDGQRG